MPHGAWTHSTLGQLVLHGTCGGQDVVNVLHFEATGAEEATYATDADASAGFDALAADWVANLLTAFRAIMPGNYVLPRVSSQVLERPANVNHRLTTVDRFPAGPPTGSTGSNATGLTTSGIIRWRTPISGRSHRGRNYFLVPDGFTGTGVLNSTAVTAYNAFLSAMITRYTPPASSVWARHFLTIYSRPYNDSYYVKRVAGVPTVIHLTNYDGNSTGVVSGLTDINLRVQRRREIGVGS